MIIKLKKFFSKSLRNNREYLKVSHKLALLPVKASIILKRQVLPFYPIFIFFDLAFILP
jgi:hypothetical protein